VELAYEQPGLGIGGFISSAGIILFAALLVLFLRKESLEAEARSQAAAAIGPSADSGSISAFFPCYNDAATLKKVVEKALAVLSGISDDFEIIIVDDGSRDESPRIADELAARYPEVRTVHHEANRGYGGALKTGISSSTKSWVFYTDGDGQYDVEDLLKLRPLTGRADVVNGFKSGRHDPWYRVVLGATYNFLIHRLFALPIKDVDCDFRLMRGDMVRSLDLQSDGGAICVEMVKGLQAGGATFAEVPVGHHEREAGKSQFFKLKNLVVMLHELLSLWWKAVVRREAWFAERK
jgi:glycosyltransferase involved in cell wall biosynthesis